MKIAILTLIVFLIAVLVIVSKNNSSSQPKETTRSEQYTLTLADKVWNRASMNECQTPRVGDKALADLLYFHNLVMNGGIHHGVETLSDSELEETIAGFSYFGLSNIVPIVRVVLIDVKQEEYNEETYNTLYHDSFNDQQINDAFKADFEKRPENYEPLNGEKSQKRSIQRKDKKVNSTLQNFNFDGFWSESEYVKKTYTLEPITDDLVLKAEKELGYKLPQSYISLLKNRNGGSPINSCVRISTATSCADEFIEISSIYGIGYKKGILGNSGSKFWVEEWGYPDIGIYIADCPSGGHDMVCLDYSLSGPMGEPRVVHIDQECGYEITVVADNFASLIENLENYENFNQDEDTKVNDDDVVSIWIDPEFAKEDGLDVPEDGLDVPEDGWIKKEDQD